ncbi:B3 domain-containing protein At3g06220-like [Salvia miltiorrhiza]|uniref:B3 domain-containing protein At3g06220-like n=1 Tax=Salvia miltiorrhiza TaxID=226208 RepID=UPI0025ABFC7D|nr:B3 domain-containing protein At3g06220-like [Salvia miltiorrhiza]
MARKRGREGRFVSTVEGAEFFKVYLPQFSSHQIRIPPDFTKNFRRALNEKVILKNKDGKTWYVEVKETPEGVFLKDGWPRFVDYHGLKVGEFLVFRYNGSYSFLVQIFGTNGCKKEKFGPQNIATHVKSEVESDNDDSSSVDRSKLFKRFEEEEEDNNNEFPKRPSFVSPPSRRKMLKIPEEVMNNENVHLEAEVNLRNAEGKEWPVNIYTMLNGPTFLGRGLCAFQRDNNVGPKDCCKFIFGNQTTIDVKILRH